MSLIPINIKMSLHSLASNSKLFAETQDRRLHVNNWELTVSWPKRTFQTCTGAWGWALDARELEPVLFYNCPSFKG